MDRRTPLIPRLFPIRDSPSGIMPNELETTTANEGLAEPP